MLERSSHRYPRHWQVALSWSQYRICGNVLGSGVQGTDGQYDMAVASAAEWNSIRIGQRERAVVTRSPGRNSPKVLKGYSSRARPAPMSFGMHRGIF